jgi:hypothetical protein
MTATSQPRRGFVRSPSMESLGFLDAPPRVWSTPPAVSRDQSASGTNGSQVTTLVTVPVGRHSQHSGPTGDLVTDLWETTELDAPSLLDWTPQSFGRKHLGRRRFRWPMVVSLGALLLVGAGLAYWLYREPASSATAALGQVQSEAETLATAIDDVAPLVNGLHLERLPEANQDASVFFHMGETARAMFAASADLPTDDSANRSTAAEAAGLAIDASRQLMDATAYRTALEPALTLPLLETNPELTDITTATESFTEWRAGFESVRAALPSGIADQATAALETISSGLETTQSAYLDAIRTDNRTVAVEVIGTLRADLLGVRQAMLTDISAVSESVDAIIEQARADLTRLLG